MLLNVQHIGIRGTIHSVCWSLEYRHIPVTRLNQPFKESHCIQIPHTGRGGKGKGLKWLPGVHKSRRTYAARSSAGVNESCSTEVTSLGSEFTSSTVNYLLHSLFSNTTSVLFSQCVCSSCPGALACCFLAVLPLVPLPPQ